MSSACVCHLEEWCFYCEMYLPLETENERLKQAEHVQAYWAREGLIKQQEEHISEWRNRALTAESLLQLEKEKNERMARGLRV